MDLNSVYDNTGRLSMLNVRIAVNSSGVARVQALGRDAEDRTRALDFILRIRPQLDAIDSAAKLSAIRTDADNSFDPA
jgi:hypothetical protein